MTTTAAPCAAEKRAPVVLAIALMLLPTAIALGLLVLGLTAPSVLFVYVSVAANLAALPAFVTGVWLLLRRR